VARLIRFPSENLWLQGVLEDNGAARAMVITHPHPLYGGDMHNPVVTAIAAACRKKGVTALRFNFRGVGESQGAYSDGVGEQQDLLAALGFLRAAGFAADLVAGYSFGSWVNARAAVESGVDASQIMVSPPLAVMNFGGVSALPGLWLVVTGAYDAIAPPDRVGALAKRLNPAARVVVIPRADHFYEAALAQLETALADAL
jgi:alpha/beta superfamily hydrolase